LQWVGSSGALSYVAGLYYFEDDGFTDNPQEFFMEFGPGAGVKFKSRYGFETTAKAMFGQVDYSINDAFTLTAGLRYTDEEKSTERCAGIPGVFDYVPCFTRAKTSFSDTTPLVGLTWKVRDDFTTYLRYAEGFKSGGFNGEAGDPSNPIPVNVAQAKTPYLPENLKSTELGAKWLFADNRGYANVALFDDGRQDMQLSIFEASGAAGSSIKNAGEANVKGLEVELGCQFEQGTRAARPRSARWTASSTSFVDRGVDVAFNRLLPHLPETTLSASLDAALGEVFGSEARLLLDATYIGDAHAVPIPGEGHDGRPRLGELGAGQRHPYQGLHGGQRAAVVRRLRDRAAPRSAWRCGRRTCSTRSTSRNMIDFGPGFGSLTQAYWGTPRTYGLEFTGRW
jgi:iron complex outermembrane receptor protein